LHGEDQGYRHQLLARAWFRVNIAAMAIGGMQAALEDSIAYAKKRYAFRQPIAGFQLIQELIADMALETDILRLLVYRASQWRTMERHNQGRFHRNLERTDLRTNSVS